MADLVDLRSDTVTHPTPAMRRAMAEAVVGDDDYGEDPTVRALEEAFAARLGKPAAVFVPSGTMANQIAFRVLAAAGTAVVAGRRQHVVSYEYGAAARNSGGAVPSPSTTATACSTPDDVRWAGRRPRTTSRRSRSSASRTPTWRRRAPRGRRSDSAAVAAAAGDVPIHLDGARLFNAEAATGWRAAVVGRAGHDRDVLPVQGPLRSGGLAAGRTRRGDRPRRRLERKRLGGGMRQAGVLAAPGLLALDEMVERLPEDHARAAPPGRGGGAALARLRAAIRPPCAPTS